MADYKFWFTLAVAAGVGVFAFALQNRVGGLEQGLESERVLRTDLQESLDATRNQLTAMETLHAQGVQTLSDKIDNLAHPVKIADTLLEGDRKAALLDAMWTEHGGSLAGSSALAAHVAQIIANEYSSELTGNIESIEAQDIAEVLAESVVFAELVAKLAADRN
ncbi:hypothetical protein [uncultured Ruegeria sp.]|uniref:hypothetical protein n=1 Tax=uncultured Ruegeria sp. TaxID=259304 RepID=UPI0026054531|nr:hypothetical protein [uncultured Ruegeria sp.]